MTNRKSAPQIDIKPGDWVLLGGTRASYPCNWYLGEVLCMHRGDLFIQRSNQNGETWRETTHISEVRANGTIDEIVSIKETARKAVHVLSQAAGECESALGRARDAVWQKLDELALGGLSVVPPDFEAIEAEGARVRATVEQADIEATS